MAEPVFVTRKAVVMRNGKDTREGDLVQVITRSGSDEETLAVIDENIDSKKSPLTSADFIILPTPIPEDELTVAIPLLIAGDFKEEMMPVGERLVEKLLGGMEEMLTELLTPETPKAEASISVSMPPIHLSA